MKKVYRIFFDALDGQEIWLNEMSDNGFRLVKTDNYSYEFERCEPSRYEYKIEFCADKSPEDLQAYIYYLEDLKLNVLRKAAVQIMKTDDNSAFLILERKNNNTPFEFQPNLDNGILYYTKIRSKFLILNAMLVLIMLLKFTNGTLFGGFNLIFMLCAAVIFFLSIEIIKYFEIIKTYKVKKDFIQ